MHVKTVLIFLLLLPFWVAAATKPPLGIKPNGHLDMPVLRKAYMESEFEKVRASLEGFLKKQPKDATRDERIFSHMYLGVICAADSNTEVKAESHFNALLNLSPHIEPVDMFVPPKIQGLFDRIKRDFLKKKDYESRFDAFGNPIVRPDSTITPLRGPGPRKPPDKTKDTPSSVTKSHSWVWWTVGSATLVAAGVGAYALMADEDSPETNRTVVKGRVEE